MAMPPRVDDGQRFNIAVNRGGADFRARKVTLLDWLRRPLAALFGRAVAALLHAPTLDTEVLARHALTPREAEVPRG